VSFFLAGSSTKTAPANGRGSFRAGDCRKIRSVAASAVKQRRPNHPGDFPFSVVAALDTNHAAKAKPHDFIFFPARDEHGDEFAEKRQVADNHHVVFVLLGVILIVPILNSRPKALSKAGKIEIQMATGQFLSCPVEPEKNYTIEIEGTKVKVSATKP
jgi:hypothetical protein